MTESDYDTEPVEPTAEPVEVEETEPAETVEPDQDEPAVEPL
jgi:hypothetical protein